MASIVFFGGGFLGVGGGLRFCNLPNILGEKFGQFFFGNFENKNKNRHFGKKKLQYFQSSQKLGKNKSLKMWATSTKLKETLEQ
jgi:hypothetical protein